MKKTNYNFSTVEQLRQRFVRRNIVNEVQRQRIEKYFTILANICSENPNVRNGMIEGNSFFTSSPYSCLFAYVDKDGTLQISVTKRESLEKIFETSIATVESMTNIATDLRPYFV